MAQPSLAPAQLAALAAWLGQTLGQECAIVSAAALTGGAIQENWLIEAQIAGHPRAFVLRKDAPATIAASHSRAREFALLQVAHAAGVRVPEPIAFCDDAGVIGAPFALMAKVAGIGFGPRIVKDRGLGGDREKLVADIGAELAKIHAIRPPAPALAFLGEPPANPVSADIDGLRASLDALAVQRPALEWGLRFLELHLAPSPTLTLIHRDLRTGNYMVDEAGLTAILDWEFANWGDPLSDIGWFCAGCWRFGHDALEAGGVGSRAAFYAGYTAAGGAPVDDARVRLWEIMAHIRWAAIALQQGARHRSGAEPSLALALTSRIVPELELAVLRATAPDAWSQRAATPTAPVLIPPVAQGEVMGADLLTIAETSLRQTMLPALSGDARAAVLMAASAMRMAAREMAAREMAAREIDARNSPQDSTSTNRLMDLIASLRAGRHDGEAGQHAALLSATARAVRLTKPELLTDSEQTLL